MRVSDIESAVSAGMLAFNAIGYGLNERISLGLVSLTGQVRFAHCIGLVEPLAVVCSLARCVSCALRQLSFRPSFFRERANSARNLHDILRANLSRHR